MERNKQKDILDILLVILFIVTAIATKFITNIVIYLIPLVLFITLIVLERKVWKCSRCGKHLPNKIWFSDVLCCPYCKENIH